MKILIAVMGLIVISTVVVLAADPTPPAHSSGNQLMQNQTHWYEKAAETVGPAAGVTAKDGTLLVLQPGSAVYMVGGSTLHEYQMNAHALKGSAVLKTNSKDIAGALQAGGIGSMTLLVPVSTFKSRESGLDKNAYEALKSDENSEIKFALTAETMKAGPAAGYYMMTAKGHLTIAGVSAPVTLFGDLTSTANQARFKGVQKLKMTDFGIKPPSISLVVTSITCTDEIEIYYDVLFAAK